MTLLLSQLYGPIIACQWGCASTASSTANVFPLDGASTSAVTTAEAGQQRSMGMAFELWRLVGAYTAAGAQSSVMTARVNGVSQASTATTVGAAAGAVKTDLTTAIKVVSTDLLSILLKFSVGDASAMNPRGWLVGRVASTF